MALHAAASILRFCPGPNRLPKCERDQHKESEPMASHSNRNSQEQTNQREAPFFSLLGEARPTDQGQGVCT